MNIKNAFEEIGRQLCEADRKNLKLLLHLIANDLQGDFQSKPGMIYRRAGAVAYQISCIGINVTLFEPKVCTQVNIISQKHLP